MEQWIFFNGWGVFDSVFTHFLYLPFCVFRVCIAGMVCSGNGDNVSSKRYEVSLSGQPISKEYLDFIPLQSDKLYNLYCVLGHSQHETLVLQGLSQFSDCHVNVRF